MQIIIHRVNTIKELRNIPIKYGVEVDIRGYGNKILLSHDPINEAVKKYDELENYLSCYQHSFIIFNIKEAGYEQRIISLANIFSIENYFLLDVEFPYLYKATRELGFKKIAIRYSEAEPIENVLAQVDNDGKPLLDWVWIDTNSILPLNEDIMNKLAPFKACLVCPDRWGHPEDIIKYRNIIKENNFKIDAIMTSLTYAGDWEN